VSDVHRIAVSNMYPNASKSDCQRRQKYAGDVHMQQARRRVLLIDKWQGVWLAEDASRRKNMLHVLADPFFFEI